MVTAKIYTFLGAVNSVDSARAFSAGLDSVKLKNTQRAIKSNGELFPWTRERQSIFPHKKRCANWKVDAGRALSYRGQGGEVVNRHSLLCQNRRSCVPMPTNTAFSELSQISCIKSQTGRTDH